MTSQPLWDTNEIEMIKDALDNKNNSITRIEIELRGMKSIVYNKLVKMLVSSNENEISELNDEIFTQGIMRLVRKIEDDI